MDTGASLNLVNIFADDFEALADFYRAVFGFKEARQYRTDIFRGLFAGPVMIGINSRKAYGLLGLKAPPGRPGPRLALNFEVGSKTAVARLTRKAERRGARVVKAPYVTYYGWYQSVLRDPEGNVFRINHPLPAKA
jgi:predicted enzyme related to lactoylglutathione lyase